MAQKVAIEHDDLEIKLGSPLYLFNSIGEMREYAKEDSNRILAFNPPTVGHTSNGLSVLNKIKNQLNCFQDANEDGHRFTFFAKGPNTGYASRKCAMIHACVLKRTDGTRLEWKYLIAEFYDIGDIHRDHRQQIANPKNLIAQDD